MTPRIVILAPYLQRDQAGAGQATIHIANALARRYPGEVVLYVFAHDRDLFDPALRIRELERPRLPRFLWRFYTFERQCIPALRAAGVPAAGLCYTQNTGMALAYRRLHPSVPIISHTGAVLAHREFREEAKRSPLQLALGAKRVELAERRSYRQPNWRHIVSTELVARQREEYFGLPAGFFAVCPYGLDFSRFDRDAPHVDMRARHGIPDTAFLIVSVARLVPWKNIDMVLRALAQSNRPLWLFVVGSGPDLDRLRSMAVDLGIRDRVRFVGHDDPAPYLAAADVFVLPSRIESFGMVYAEAMSMGLPCIGLRNNPPEVLSSAQDVIPEGEAGYCVSSTEELRERLDELADSPGTVRRLGEFGHDLAQRAYTTERYVECLGVLQQSLATMVASA